MTIGSEAWRWRRHNGRTEKDGAPVALDVYSFMTTMPNELVGTINHERMPVLLSTDAEFQTWLIGTAEDAFALLREYPPEKMRMVQSGFEKRDMLEA